jgi:predicted amidophosphoribosyltransferase
VKEVLPDFCPQCDAPLNGCHNCWNCIWVWEFSDYEDPDLWSDKEKFDRLRAMRESKLKRLIRWLWNW